VYNYIKHDLYHVTAAKKVSTMPPPAKQLLRFGNNDDDLNKAEQEQDREVLCSLKL
jgi:hypothetical protein